MAVVVVALRVPTPREGGLSSQSRSEASTALDVAQTPNAGERAQCRALSGPRIESLGKLRVALDLRDLPPEQVGSRTYAVNLARELGKLPDLELTLLVQNPAQARGMHGRVVAAAAWGDDVAVIHKPAQVLDPAELRLLFESNAQLVITYQDLIAFRIPLVFASESRFDTYRATSRLVLPAVQQVIAISQSVRDEIAAEFGIPHSEIPVVKHGADSGNEPRAARRRLSNRLPRRYFFSLASDYPHKNLPNLLDAYSRLRARWSGGEPPHLVLAGYSSGARSGLYPQLEHEPSPRGVLFLGPVRQDRLVNLFKHAEALVFASLYEGFGLPPLEAMAMGTPVIAMPVSAMPAVCGDAALYPRGLSAEALCCAMERVASEPELRKDLRERGFERVRAYSWEKTAKATFEAYRSTMLSPSERSLRMRRLLRDSIIDWSAKNTRPGTSALATAGIREAGHALLGALRARAHRGLRRRRSLSPGRVR
jgi:glycosyltransferase involved in cell wall biosynthesis